MASTTAIEGAIREYQVRCRRSKQSPIGVLAQFLDHLKRRKRWPRKDVESLEDRLLQALGKER